MQTTTIIIIIITIIKAAASNHLKRKVKSTKHNFPSLIHSQMLLIMMEYEQNLVRFTSQIPLSLDVNNFQKYWN
ncbi:hypothetical protein QVD17_37545 [Tagetes erecta]|uniref:Uncharacterized protein n=1 Tax=Tagetes erecta TaxID=13708 RepID=A0AAD8NJA3_TARER|nr:hypothetical protein QVD17_37545 [Tagetes erecta]